MTEFEKYVWDNRHNYVFYAVRYSRSKSGMVSSYALYILQGKYIAPLAGLYEDLGVAKVKEEGAVVIRGTGFDKVEKLLRDLLTAIKKKYSLTGEIGSILYTIL